MHGVKNIASNKSSSFLSIVRDGQVQPNAVDIKIDKMFAIKHRNTFYIDEEEKLHRGSTEIEPDEDGVFKLEANTSYEFLAEGEISVGPDEAGWVITRSTLNRNGIFLTSGLYDSGYHGVMAGPFVQKYIFPNFNIFQFLCNFLNIFLTYFTCIFVLF